MVSYVASDASGPTDAAISLTTPSGTTGDEIVAFGAGYQVASSVPPFFDGDATFLADFTDTASANSGTDTVTSARLRTTDGTEDASYSMDHDRDTYGAFVSMVRVGASQLQTTSGGVYTNSGSHDVPAMTIDTNSSIIVLMLVGFNSAPTTSDYTTAGYTQRETLDGGFFQIFTKEVNAGSESAITGASDADAVNIAIVLEPADTPSTRQEGYRWREDGTEASPTWEAAQDTVATMPVSTTQILRAIVEEYGSADQTDGYSWKWRHEDDSLWTDPGVVRGSITFVGSDSGQQGANTTDITLTMPGAAAEDDIAIIYARADEAGTVPDLTLQTATGWTQVVDENPTSGRDRVEAVWWKRIGASEGNPVVQISTAEEHSASLHVFRGVDTVTALDATTTFNSGQNDATPTAVGITTVTANAAVVIGHGSTHDDIDTAIPPSGYTLGENIVGGTNDHRGQVVAYDLDVGAAAAQSPGDWLHDVSVAATAEWSVWAIALRPASSVAAFDWSASANIANGGTDTTTAQLTAPSGKTTADHDTGRRADDGATASFTTAADEYSEIEFAIEAHANAVAGETYQLKVVKDSGVDLDDYPVTIQWTIPAGGPVSGDGDADLTITGSATGSYTAQGAGDADVTVTGSADGQRTTRSSGDADVSVTGSATGSYTAQGSADADVSITASASGDVTAQGAATATLSVSASASGGITHQAAGAASVGLSGAATGSYTAQGQGGADLAITGTADGTIGGAASGAASISITGSASGDLTAQGQGGAEVSITGQADGQRTTRSSAAADISITASASGTRTVSGAGTASVSITGSATGAFTSLGAGSASLSITATASGGATVTGSGAASLSITGSAEPSGVFDPIDWLDIRVRVELAEDLGHRAGVAEHLSHRVGLDESLGHRARLGF